MKLYLDQMFREDLAARLRAAGHDVVRASDAGQDRADDAEILEHAVSTGRVLVTLYEHFGDWVILPLTRHSGVIRVKTHPPTTRRLTHVLLPFLEKYDQESLRDHLVIVTPTRERWINTAQD